jgi:hypothetical protein
LTAWSEVAAAEPDLADHVRRCFGVRKHATLATLRRDGSPRISGTEVEFSDDGAIYLGAMPGSVKALDLRRDPRLALHSPTVDPPEADPSSWLGDAKIAGRAEEVSDPQATSTPHRFRIDVEEIVVITVAGNQLEIRSWHPDRGLERRRR